MNEFLVFFGGLVVVGGSVATGFFTARAGTKNAVITSRGPEWEAFTNVQAAQLAAQAERLKAQDARLDELDRKAREDRERIETIERTAEDLKEEVSRLRRALNIVTPRYREALRYIKALRVLYDTHARSADLPPLPPLPVELIEDVTDPPALG